MIDFSLSVIAYTNLSDEKETKNIEAAQYAVVVGITIVKGGMSYSPAPT